MMTENRSKTLNRFFSSSSRMHELDGKYLDQYSVRELRAELEKRHLRVIGVKTALVKRLKEALALEKQRNLESRANENGTSDISDNSLSEDEDGIISEKIIDDNVENSKQNDNDDLILKEVSKDISSNTKMQSDKSMHSQSITTEVETILADENNLAQTIQHDSSVESDRSIKTVKQISHNSPTGKKLASHKENYEEISRPSDETDILSNNDNDNSGEEKGNDDEAIPNDAIWEIEETSSSSSESGLLDENSSNIRELVDIPIPTVEDIEKFPNENEETMPPEIRVATGIFEDPNEGILAVYNERSTSQNTNDTANSYSKVQQTSAGGGGDEDSVIDLVTNSSQSAPDMEHEYSYHDHDDNNTISMSVERESNISTPSSSNTVYVRGISDRTTAVDIKHLFKTHAKIKKVRIVDCVSYGGMENERCAHVIVGSSEDVDECIKHFDNTELHGVKISVTRLSLQIEYIKPPRGFAVNRETRLLTSIDLEEKDERIRQYVESTQERHERLKKSGRLSKDYSRSPTPAKRERSDNSHHHHQYHRSSRSKHTTGSERQRERGKYRRRNTRSKSRQHEEHRRYHEREQQERLPPRKPAQKQQEYERRLREIEIERDQHYREKKRRHLEERNTKTKLEEIEKEKQRLQMEKEKIEKEKQEVIRLENLRIQREKEKERIQRSTTSSEPKKHIEQVVVFDKRTIIAADEDYRLGPEAKRLLYDYSGRPISPNKRLNPINSNSIVSVYGKPNNNDLLNEPIRNSEIESRSRSAIISSKKVKHDIRNIKERQFEISRDPDFPLQYSRTNNNSDGLLPNPNVWDIAAAHQAQVQAQHSIENPWISAGVVSEAENRGTSPSPYFCKTGYDGKVEYWGRGDTIPDPRLGFATNVPPVPGPAPIWGNSNSGLLPLSYPIGPSMNSFIPQITNPPPQRLGQFHFGGLLNIAGNTSNNTNPQNRRFFINNNKKKNRRFFKHRK